MKGLARFGLGRTGGSVFGSFAQDRYVESKTCNQDIDQLMLLVLIVLGRGSPDDIDG